MPCMMAFNLSLIVMRSPAPVALVADRQRILAINAIGFAEFDEGKPMQTDSVF